MRNGFESGWAFAFSESLERIVENSFPHDTYRWPTLCNFKAEFYIWQSNFFIVILRNKMGGLPYIGKIINLEDNLAPKDSPSLDNLIEWHNYLREKFALKAKDFEIIIPLIDSGKEIEDDWKLWPEEFKELWHKQVEYLVERYYYWLKGVSIMNEFYIPPGYGFLNEECFAFLKDHPNYNKNIFIITRFDSDSKLLVKLDEQIRRALSSNGLESVRADDRMYMPDRNLWNNVCVYMICCKYGIAILEDRIKDEFNPNVALEYGFMRALNKPVLLLADTGFRNLRADIIGTLRETFDITDIDGTIHPPIQKWLRDLNLL